MLSVLTLEAGEIQLYTDKKCNHLFNVDFFSEVLEKMTIRKNKGQ